MKNPSSDNSSDNNIQSVENLTFEDFTALEIMISQSITNFLDMKYREKVAIQTQKNKGFQNYSR